jgi:hypothetical protein
MCRDPDAREDAMKLRDAFKLKKGDSLLYYHSVRSARCHLAQSYRVGRVENVTERGGILVSHVRPYKVHYRECGSPDTKEWVNYQRGHSKADDPMHDRGDCRALGRKALTMPWKDLPGARNEKVR